eukprot:sb/3478949/
MVIISSWMCRVQQTRFEFREPLYTVTESQVLQAVFCVYWLPQAAVTCAIFNNANRLHANQSISRASHVARYQFEIKTLIRAFGVRILKNQTLLRRSK